MSWKWIQRLSSVAWPSQSGSAISTVLKHPQQWPFFIPSRHRTENKTAPLQQLFFKLKGYYKGWSRLSHRGCFLDFWPLLLSFPGFSSWLPLLGRQHPSQVQYAWLTPERWLHPESFVHSTVIIICFATILYFIVEFVLYSIPDAFLLKGYFLVCSWADYSCASDIPTFSSSC